MLHVIYDDHCGFCIRLLKICRAADSRTRLHFHGSSVFRLKPEAATIANADFDNAMFVVGPDGKVTRGFFACRRIIRELPLLWPLVPLVYFPGASRVGPRIYDWVARNRHRFGCESDVCGLPEMERPRL
jgi:predicted DCC family thiol-disulfide oxidoreductase YuxK